MRRTNAILAIQIRYDFIEERLHGFRLGSNGLRSLHLAGAEQGGPDKHQDSDHDLSGHRPFREDPPGPTAMTNCAEADESEL